MADFETQVADTLGSDLPADTGSSTNVDTGSGNTNTGQTNTGGSTAARGPAAKPGLDAALDRIDPAGAQQLGAQQQPKPGQQQQQQRGPIKDFETNEEVKPGQMQRYFFGMKNAQKELQTLKQRYQNVDAQLGELEGYRNSNAAASQLGLKAEDQAVAFNLLAQLRKDPKATLKSLLTQVQASGIDLNEITGGAGALNAETLQQMIAKQLEPVTGAFRQQQVHAEEVANIEGEFGQLYNDAPEARQNEGLIGAILEQNPNMSAQQAWYQLAIRAQRFGFDTSKPLLPQLQARAQTQNGGGGNTNVVDLPMGRRNVNGSAAVDNSGRMADHRMSNKDIVAEAMREAGLKVH